MIAAGAAPSGPQSRGTDGRVRSALIPGVHFAGFSKQFRIPQADATGDIFARPSRRRETLGTVVCNASVAVSTIVSEEVEGPDDSSAAVPSSADRATALELITAPR